MNSMTGFGHAEYSCENYNLIMELKTVNSRFLEINCIIPPSISAYEQTLTQIIKENIQRGHVDVLIRLKVLKGAVDVTLDENTALSYINALKKVKSMVGEEIDTTMDLSRFATLDSVLVSSPKAGVEACKEGLDYCTKEVISQVNSSRAREGEAMKKNFESLIDSMEKSLLVVKENAADMERSLRDSLEKRINEILEDRGYDENRVLTEVAVLLNKYTISEEMVRLDAHISEFRRLIASSEPVGKRMDFLCQEMNREVNTIGSKNQDVKVSFEVVNMKDCLENIREQTRNIE